MIAPLSQDQRTPARFQCRQDVIENHRIARLIAAERRIDGWHGHSRSFQPLRQPEFSVANADLVMEPPPQGLGLGVHAMTHRSALHEDNRMVRGSLSPTVPTHGMSLRRLVPTASV